jgi:hypothetical protein
MGRDGFKSKKEQKDREIIKYRMHIQCSRRINADSKSTDLDIYPFVTGLVNGPSLVYLSLWLPRLGRASSTASSLGGFLWGRTASIAVLSLGFRPRARPDDR